uniref:Uncharacterized protein n=1 Tax=viral metagenome TaxID=1070528 RepID=A0A6C0CKU5_9ZZZZ
MVKTAVEICQLTENHLERERQIYRELVDECLKQIRKTAEKSKVFYYIYTIPTFIIGKPKYQMDRARKYIENKLTKEHGFKIKKNDSKRDIIISWKHLHKKMKEDLKKTTEENTQKNRRTTVIKSHFGPSSNDYQLPANSDLSLPPPNPMKPAKGVKSVSLLVNKNKL